MEDACSEVVQAQSSGTRLAAARTDTAVVTPPAPPSPVLVRATSDRRRLEAWALVLVSMGVSPLARAHDGGFELWVEPESAKAASRELDAVDAEEVQVPRAERRDPVRERKATRRAGVGAVVVAALLLAFSAVTGNRTGGSAWFAAGASDAERVLAGEWWRAVTALTLHADTAHVVSNVGIGTLVVGAVMRSEGIGWGAALVLAAGTAGNVANAWAHQTLHSSVGFSTAVFGAIGILGGLAFVRSREQLGRRRPAWTALGGTFALLALLGSSERSDVFAHLFGGVAGVAIGLTVAWIGFRPKSIVGQSLAGLGTATAVLGAWFVALH